MSQQEHHLQVPMLTCNDNITVLHVDKAGDVITIKTQNI